MSAASEILAQHVAERMLADVEVLEQVGALQSESAAAIRAQLYPLLSDEATAVASTAAAVTALSVSAAPQARPGVPRPAPLATEPKDLAKALWAYAGDASDELSFSVNDVVVVTERTSSDWWKGHVQGKPAAVGLFPSNYVETIAASPALAPARVMPPAYRPSVTGASHSSEKSHSTTQASSGERSTTIGPGKWKPGVSRWSSGASEKEPQAVSPYSTPAAGPSAPPPPGVNPNAPTPEDPAIAQAKRDRVRRSVPSRSTSSPILRLTVVPILTISSRVSATRSETALCADCMAGKIL